MDECRLNESCVPITEKVMWNADFGTRSLPTGTTDVFIYLFSIRKKWIISKIIMEYGVFFFLNNIPSESECMPNKWTIAAVHRITSTDVESFWHFQAIWNKFGCWLDSLHSSIWDYGIFLIDTIERIARCFPLVIDYEFIVVGSDSCKLFAYVILIFQ